MQESKKSFESDTSTGSFWQVVLLYGISIGAGFLALFFLDSPKRFALGFAAFFCVFILISIFFGGLKNVKTSNFSDASSSSSDSTNTYSSSNNSNAESFRCGGGGDFSGGGPSGSIADSDSQSSETSSSDSNSASDN